MQFVIKVIYLVGVDTAYCLSESVMVYSNAPMYSYCGSCKKASN